MEEPWGPNTPQEFEDYDRSESPEPDIGLGNDDSVEFVEFGYEDSETDYPLEEDSKERASLIGSFQTVFTDENSPYDENWDYETTNGFLDWTSEQDYEGLLAVDEGKVVGFSWGYRVDPGEVAVDEKFPDELRELDRDIYDGETFMIDEVGVLPEYRGQGIATELESGLLEKIDERENVSRVMQRTQWSGENTGKLFLDGKMGFQAFLIGRDNDPVTQEVEFVGKEGSDQRIYLSQELEGEKPWK
jgi:GNAT superfamily N-acetyltransferase